jgi:hypothetical protein
MRKTPINFLFWRRRKYIDSRTVGYQIKRQKNNDRHGQYPTNVIFPTILVFHYRLPVLLKFNYPDILCEGLDVFGPEELSLLWRGLGGGQA